MKQRFFERIGKWSTPPCIRKSLMSLKALTLLLVMVASVNVWGAEATWTLVETAPTDWSGEYLVVYNAGCFNGSLTTGFDQHAPVAVTISNKKITLDDKYAMFVAKSGDKYSFKTASGYYIGRNANSNGMDANETWSTNFTVVFNNWNTTNKTVQIAGNGGRALGRNSNTWRFYASSNAYTNLQLYKKESATPTEPVAPSITTQPQRASYDQNATATALTIAASGNPTPTYQWYSNTTESTSGASLISGATNASYTPSTATIGTKYYYCVATNTKGSATSDIVAVTVTAALPKITIDGNASGITTTDETQSIIVGDFEFGGYFKQYSTTALWFTSGSGFIYNKESFGKIKKITINYKSGGSALAYQYIRLGNDVLDSYAKESTNGVKYETSTGGASNTFDVVGDYEYFCISVDNKNLQASSIVITYEENKTPSIEADVEAIAFAQKELSGTATDSKNISATGKNLTAAISAEMKEGSDAIFSVTPVGTPTAAAGEFTVSYSTDVVGEYSGTVVLSSGETSIEIPVSASVVAHIPVLQSIYVKEGASVKKEYTVGDAFETAGLEVWGKYDVGEDQQMEEGIEWEVTPATFSATTETSVSVVAKALEKTSEPFAVTGLTVNAAPQIATFSGTAGSDVVFTTGSSSAAGAVWAGSPCAKSIITLTGEVTSGTNYSYYDGSVVRFYMNNKLVLTPANGYKITKVEIVRQSTTGSNGGTINCEGLTADANNTTTNTNIFTGDKKGAVTFTASAQARFKSITVHYAAAAPAAATPTITPSAEAETYFENITVTLATETEGAKIYYTTDGSVPTAASTLYENSIAVSATTTIKAIAVKEGLDNSEVASKTFTFGPVFTNLADLAAADLTSGTIVKVSFENVEIKSIFESGAGKRQGIYFDIQKGEKYIEIYYASVEVPESWVAGGTVSGTMICPWKQFTDGTWELAPAANSWNWSKLTYNVPAGTTEVVLTGTPNKTVYVDGEAFDPAGVTVTATINGVPTVVTEGITWSVETLTLGTTSINITATYNDVVSNTIENFAVIVNPIQESTIADFISNEGGRCYLVGEITSTISSGSFTLTDESGSIYVYKHTLDGVASIAQGDYIKVIADEYEYYQSKTHEAKNVVVIDKPEKPIVAVTGISLNKDNATITIGKSVTLVATIEPATASDKEVIWTSSNDAVATVEGGVVSAVAAGSAVITAKSHENEEIFATCNVTVVAAQVKYFALATSTADLDAAVTNGKKVVIAPAPSVETAKVMGTYASGNNIAAIEADFNDEYTALEAGEDAFYTIAKDGDYYTFQDGNGKYIYAAGGTSSNHLKAYETLDDKGKWTVEIDDEGVATIKCVNQSTTRNWIRFNNSDATNLMFSCYASGQKAIALYVEAEKPQYVPVESIELNATSAKVIAGKKLTLIATVGPDNATQKGVTWTSDNDKVTVEDGLVTIDAETEVGTTATITATTVGTTTEGGSEHLSATCIITVIAPVVADYELVTDASTLQAGDIIVLAATKDDNTYVNGDLSGDYLTKIEATIDDGILTATGACEFVLGGEAGAWTLTSIDGTLGATAVKKLTYDDTKTGFASTWTISIDENNNATIAPDAEGYGRFMYNVNSPRFLTYASTTSATMLLPQLYRKPFVTVRENLTVGSYGTICWPKDVVSYTGATFYQVDNKDEAAHEMYFNEVTDGEKLNAGQAYLFQATDATIQFKEGTTEVVEPISGEAARGFYGVFERQECQSDREWYGIYGTKIQPMAAGAGVPANRAYIKLDEVPTESYVEAGASAPRRLAMVVPKSTATDLYLIDHKEGVRKMMMKNQIIIIREGRHYNVHGQMLK